MINVNELRLGNWVDMNGELERWSLMHFDYGYCADANPIPLSPDILLKIGFEMDGFGAYNLDINPFKTSIHFRQLSFSQDYLYIREGVTKERQSDDLVTLWNKDIMKEFYLHTLQNLVHALTGQELTINL